MYKKQKLNKLGLNSKEIQRLIDNEIYSLARSNTYGYDRYWRFCRWLYFDFYCKIRGFLRVIFGTRIVKDQFGRVYIVFGNKFNYPSPRKKLLMFKK